MGPIQTVATETPSFTWVTEPVSVPGILNSDYRRTLNHRDVSIQIFFTEYHVNGYLPLLVVHLDGIGDLGKIILQYLMERSAERIIVTSRARWDVVGGSEEFIPLEGDNYFNGLIIDRKDAKYTEDPPNPDTPHPVANFMRKILFMSDWLKTDPLASELVSAFPIPKAFVSAVRNRSIMNMHTHSEICRFDELLFTLMDEFKLPCTLGGYVSAARMTSPSAPSLYKNAQLVNSHRRERDRPFDVFDLIYLLFDFEHIPLQRRSSYEMPKNGFRFKRSEISADRYVNRYRSLNEKELNAIGVTLRPCADNDEGGETVEIVMTPETERMCFIVLSTRDYNTSYPLEKLIRQFKVYMKRQRT
jgi:hypothetical protein